MNTIKEVLSYKEMIIMLVKRNLRGRYKNSVLGFAWTFINPLLQLLVYTVVFSAIMRTDVDRYYLFLFVALIPWIAFSGSVMDGSSCIVLEKSLVTKIYFPRQVLPIVTTVTNFVNMLLCFIVVFAVCLMSIGVNIVALIYLIPVIIVEFILALGISFIVSSITVYFRDLQHILGIVMMAWQFLTPVMYSVDLVPDKLKFIFYCNPMTSVIVAYRDILYYKRIPALNTMTSAFVMGVLFLIIGWFVFKKLERRFAEVL